MISKSINKILTKHQLTAFNKYFWQKGYHNISDLRILVENKSLGTLIEEFDLNPDESKKVCKLLKRCYYCENALRLTILSFLILGVVLIGYIMMI